MVLCRAEGGGRANISKCQCLTIGAEAVWQVWERARSAVQSRGIASGCAVSRDRRGKPSLWGGHVVVALRSAARVSACSCGWGLIAAGRVWWSGCGCRVQSGYLQRTDIGWASPSGATICRRR